MQGSTVLHCNRGPLFDLLIRMPPVKPPFQDLTVEEAYNAFPAPARKALIRLRALIFQTAKTTPGVGALEETLKWGAPAYLTSQTRSGSTLRLGIPKAGGFAIYAHCQTTIISDFQSQFPDDFTYEGNRAVVFKDGDALRLDQLRLLIAHGLTYHLK